MTKQGRMVCILDDSPEDRAAVRRHLAHDRVGYRFIEFGSADEAVEACRTSPPDCVLLDYELQDGDGLEALERLTDGTGSAPCAVIMLTGRGSEAIAVQALKRGATDYMVKGSYSPDVLRRTVADALIKFASRPSVEQQRSERERAHRAAGGADRGREWLVLIVDDSKEDRLAARRALSQGGPGYRFLEEATAAEGLALCRSAGLDCLLLDYSLPDADGIEFLDELTGGTGITPFPVIMLTGRGDEAVAVQALKHGAVDYLIKGRYTPNSLRNTIDQAVERLVARRVQEEQRVRVLERLEAESRRRADQLVEADRRKDEFLAMLAHELRNPLAPIATALHLLRRVDSLPEVAAKAVDIAGRQVKHLSRMVDDLMEVSRITRGKIAIRKETVELGPIVRRAAEAARPLVDSKGHELALAVPDGPIHVHADPTRLEQVFTNLLNNAAKYTDPGGRISIEVVRDGRTAAILVQDDGIGIDAETLPRVFDLFAQADRSLDRSQGGLGIGLTLVRALAEQHGGSVEARSDGPGSGSVFIVHLPILEDASAADERAPATAEVPAPLKVLVVDDNVDGAEMVATLFRSSGYDAHTAADGASGLAAIGEIRPDVVFLDIGLPRMNGYEVARAVLAQLGPDAPILAAFTGYGGSEDRLRSRDAGFRHHLVKPVDPDELLRVAAEAAEARHLAGSDGRAKRQDASR